MRFVRSGDDGFGLEHAGGVELADGGDLGAELFLGTVQRDEGVRAIASQVMHNSLPRQY